MVSRVALKGLVLAGGLSRRMGTDKAALKLDGQTLLERAVDVVHSVIDDVYVSARADQQDEALRSRFRLIPDAYENIGPAAGILSAHAAFPECAWLVIACDMPLLSAALIARLIDARDASMDATAWTSADDGLPEPLCALYEPATLAAFRLSVEAGGASSPRSWLANARVKRLSAPSGEALGSANTPQEFQQIAAGMRNPANNGNANG